MNKEEIDKDMRIQSTIFNSNSVNKIHIFHIVQFYKNVINLMMVHVASSYALSCILKIYWLCIHKGSFLTLHRGSLIFRYLYENL